MKKSFQFSIWFIIVFSMLSLFCDMPSDPFKKPSNSKVKLFLEENEQTIDFGSEVKIGVSIFLAEHIEALHVYTRKNGLDSIHTYNSNAVDDTLYFSHKFTEEGKDTIFVTGKLKNKNYTDKTDTLPIFILPAPDSIRFDSIPQSLSTVTENHDTLLFTASLRSEKPLSFSVKSQPALDTNQLKITQFKDTACVVLTTDTTGEYAVTLYAKRDTLIDSAVVNVTVYEPLVFESAVLSDFVPLGKSDTIVFTVPTERVDTLTCKLLNEDDFAENELSFIVQNSDSLVIVFTPDSGGWHEFLLILDNGKISDTLKYTVTVDDNPSVGLFIENFDDSVPFGSPVNIGVSVFLPQLIEELHILTSDNSLDSALELSATDDTVYVSHEFYTEGEVKIYVTAKPVNSDYEEKIDSMAINVLPAPEEISFDSIPGKLHTVTGLTDTLLFLAKSSKGNSLEFSVKSDPALDSDHLEVVQSNDTARVIVTTDEAGKYGITLYAKRDTLKDSAKVDAISYEPLVFETVVISDMVALGSSDSLVFVIPTEREDTITYKLINKDDFAENELSFIVENSDSLVIVFTPDSGGIYEFLLLLNNGKISDTLKYSVTVDDNPSVGLSIENHEDTVPFGTPVNIVVSVFIPQLIKELHISTSDNSLDSALELAATDDTVYVSHEFYTEGEVKIYVTAKPVNSDYEEKIDSMTITVLPANEEISFDSIPGKLHTVTDLTDTLIFTAKSSKGNTLEFSVKSDPALDSDHLEVVQSNDTARVIVTTDEAGKYGITLYAKRDTLKDSAKVDLISYEPLVFKTVIVPDTISLGSSDSLVFVVPTERKDTLTCKLLNEDEFSETEISVLPESTDSLVIAFTPETEGQREFVMLITNEHIEDTLRYEVFVSEKIPVWNITEKAIDAIEGEEISVDLRNFINKSFSGDFSLDSDLGEIQDTIWKWTPSWGSDTTKTAVITAVCDSDEYKLKLNISITEGDTTGPTIRLLHSSTDDTIIGSSQIYVEAVVKDSGAGVSSVQISYGSNSANMALAEDSIYIGPVRNLKNGEKTEIKIVAEDGSMRKNVTEHVFYVTYDSTIGDNEAPVISQVSGPENDNRITDGQIPLSFSVTDDSDIDSVYWTLGGTYQGLMAQKDSIYSLSGTLDEYGLNEIEIFAVDKSVNRNRNSMKLVYDYNTKITGIEIISPEDDTSDVDTSGVTFEWSGGNDEDGDTVFFELLYDTSKTNLDKKITGVNCSNLVLSEKLKSYTDYYWQVIAYSKSYSDTVKSSIYSFKTEAVPPEITSQSDKNIDIDIGEKVVLWVSATGNPKPSFIWKRNGTVISGENNDSLVINDVSLTDSGGYVVQVNNDGGTVSDTIDLRIIYPLKVSAGGTHSLILKNNGSLWACGNNEYGQLGIKNEEYISTPREVTNGVEDIAAGGQHSFILKNDGSLWACGYNMYGQCGIEYQNEQDLFEIVETVNNAIAITAGYEHSMLLKNDNSLWACGYNGNGRLGIENVMYVYIPEKLIDNVKSVAAGYRHNLILKNDGSLWACGDNYNGQLGIENQINILEEVTTINDVKSIACGGSHSLILKNNNSLWACGDNSSGQLGIETEENVFIPEQVTENVKNIAAGSSHSLIIKNDGSLWTCGYNGLGQLGNGTTENKSTPVRIIPKSTDP